MQEPCRRGCHQEKTSFSTIADPMILNPQQFQMLEFLARFCNDPPRFTTQLPGVEPLRLNPWVSMATNKDWSI
jgi:hypothetical protein